MPICHRPGALPPRVVKRLRFRAGGVTRHDGTAALREVRAGSGSVRCRPVTVRILLGSDREPGASPRSAFQAPGAISSGHDEARRAIRQRGQTAAPTHPSHRVHHEPGPHTGPHIPVGTQMGHKRLATGPIGTQRTDTGWTAAAEPGNDKTPGRRAFLPSFQGLGAEHPQRDSNPCRHLERVRRSACSALGLGGA